MYKGKKQKSIKVNYPETIKKAIIDTLFGTEVIDNYRWLEDDRSEETENWIKAENEVTFNYLSKIPYREASQKAVDKIMELRKARHPFY